MKDRIIVKECKLCEEVIKANSGQVMLQKMKSHLETCHPGFETIRNDFNQDY